MTLGFVDALGQSYYPCSCLLPEKYVPLVAFVNEAPVRDMPSKDGAIIAKLHFGQERATNLDIKEEVLEEGKKRTYRKIRTGEGEEGWVNLDQIVLCGQGRVVNQETIGSRIADKGNDNVSFFAGEPVIVTETEGNYMLAYSKDKTKNAWIPISNLIDGIDEIKTALLYAQAHQTKDPATRLQRLSNLKQYTNKNLQIYSIIEQNHAIAAANMPASMPANVAQIENREIAEASMGNTKSTKKIRGITTKSPDTKKTIAENVAATRDMTPKKETAVSIDKVLQNSSSSKSKKTETKKVLEDANTDTREAASPSLLSTNKAKIAVNPTMKRETYSLCTQYWKYSEKLTLKTLSANKESEWVCNHPTLPIGTKVHLAIPDNAGFVVLNVIGKSAKEGSIEIPATIISRLFGDTQPEEVQTSFYTAK